ncbi:MULTISPECIES: hypothetical protein [Streptomycetaceae]|uniref:hypothetical protein n=1 Tax=Streptomycetaceae TaxID=2062 RepID=UPI00093AA3A7|nr:hypothetical protein [Streptomyces sp. CB02056]OKI03526.1 hypothetical protein AMK13_24085 [Streptomyces sp. CB02056]
MELSFVDAYTIWSHVPYPPHSTTPELGKLRADLAIAHEHTTGAVVFMRTGAFRPSGADVLTELDEIITQAGVLCGEYAGEDLVVAREIHAYATLLAIVYRGFLEAGESV